MEKNIRRFIFSVFVQDIFAIPLARLFIKLHVKANYVTLLGLFFSIASGLLYIDHSYVLGSILFFGALVMDSTDGRVARGTNTFSDFGAKLDAVTDKVRSFLVAFCFVWSLNYGLTVSVFLFGFYILLPVIRLIMSRKDESFYDPTILFWNATPFKNWFVKHKVWGFYAGWERSVLALIIAPLVLYKVEVFVFAVVLEQLLFALGLLFFKNSRVVGE
jgi:phosphatidylglycerophosphate synthase